MQVERTELTAGTLPCNEAAFCAIDPLSEGAQRDPDPHMKPSRIAATRVASLAALTVAYFGAGWFGLHVASTGLLAAPIWPPAGLALAAMLLWGRNIWPAVFLGAFSVNFIRLLETNSPWLPAIGLSLPIAAGNVAEAVVGTWLVNRFARGQDAFRQPQLVLRFTAVAALAVALGASFGTAVAALGRVGGAHQPLSFWLTWWLGDLVSVLVLTPLVLVWSSGGRPLLGIKRICEGAALVALLALVGWMVFSGDVASITGGANLTFMVVPPLLWAAMRFGQRGIATLTFIIACVAITGTLHGHGPFGVANRLTSFLVLQNFIAVISVMSLMLAADVDQRQRMETSLRASEQRYRELFELSPQPMWVYDYETLRFLAVNDAALQRYGYSRQELLDMSITDIRPPETVPLLLEDVTRARDGFRGAIQRRHRKKDGTVIDVELNRHSLIFDGRQAAMVLCRDITEQKRAAGRATIFSELGRRLSVATTTRGAATIIAETADKLFGWDACVLDLCSPDQSTIESVYCIDTNDGRRTEFFPPERRPGDLAFEVLRTGPRLILRPNPPEFSPGLRPMGNMARPSASLMYVPLRDEEQAVGIFSIQSYSPNAYTQENLQTLEALAGHCSGALARIRAELEIQRLNRELRRHLEEMQTIFNVAPVGIAVSRDPECRTLTGNPACQALFGTNGVIVLSENGAAGHLPFRLQRQGQDVPFDESPLQRVARQGLAVRGEELDLVFPDGRVVNSHISASPLYDDAGRLRGSLAVIVDLTERKRAEQEVLRLNAELEQRVRERTTQIEAVNKELEAFCYSVSHDLRAPLRSIRGFSEVLLERYADKLDARGQEFLRRACQSSAQMDALIEDLLKLSRVSRSDTQRRDVDLSNLAAQIVGELRTADPQRAIETNIAAGLHALADEGLVRIVLENLLRNAWKFTGKTAQPRIEVGVTTGSVPAFFVRDNGAGFEMAHADRLFGVFQRLHSASEFPGTGVGLATVQRIINRHGGRAWAEGQPGYGATFYFTLPPQGLC